MDDYINPNMAEALKQCGFGDDEETIRRLLVTEKNEKNNGDANISQVVVEYDKIINEIAGAKND